MTNTSKKAVITSGEAPKLKLWSTPELTYRGRVDQILKDGGGSCATPPCDD